MGHLHEHGPQDAKYEALYSKVLTWCEREEINLLVAAKPHWSNEFIKKLEEQEAKDDEWTRRDKEFKQMSDLIKSWACLLEMGEQPKKANECKEVLVAFCAREKINFDLWSRNVLGETNITTSAKEAKERAARQLAERAHHVA